MKQKQNKLYDPYELKKKYGKILKINVGCGPYDKKDGWINVDIQEFKTVDFVMDVTKD